MCQEILASTGLWNFGLSAAPSTGVQLRLLPCSALLFMCLLAADREWEKGSSRLIPGLVLTAENGNSEYGLRRSLAYPFPHIRALFPRPGRLAKAQGRDSLLHNVVVNKHGGKMWCEIKIVQETTFYTQLPIKLMST